MPDFPVTAEQATPLFIHPWTEFCTGLELRQVNGTAVPAAFTWTANQAVYIPFSIPWPYPVRRVFWYNGSTITSSNADFGIYTEGAARIYSTGSTALSGASAIQYVSVSTPFVLAPGRYFMAYTCSNTTSRVFAVGQSTAQGKLLGFYTQASALPLPDPATFAAYAGVGFPVCGFTRTASGF